MSNWDKVHIPCPCGKSSDAYCIDKKGNGHCFSCSKSYGSNKEEKDLLYGYYPHRGISQQAFKKYGVETSFLDTDTPIETGFKYPNGAVKIRSNILEKNQKGHFRSIGSMKDAGCFGTDIFDPNGATIVIVEGEYDCLASWDMTNLPTISPRSSSSARTDCKKDWDFINSFSKIIIAVDNDEPGERCAREIASLFDFHKVYRAKLTEYKDANEYLVNKKGFSFAEALKKAKKYTPDNIINTFEEIAESLRKSKEDKIGTYPFQGLQNALHGLYRGEYVVFKGPEGIGKQLANTTLLPTPCGWTRMGDIKVGDILFDEKGNQTKVTYVTEDQFVESYEVTFDDGTFVIAGGPHKWGVYEEGYYKVLTTQQMFDSPDSLYQIPLTKPVKLPYKRLLVDPYSLGYWLGDGHSYSANISVGYSDWKNIQRIFGEDIIFQKEDKTCMTIRLHSLPYKLLSKLEVIKNKHIPLDYLRCSIDQRFELLQGLMDSDGGVHKDGTCEFYTSNKQLKNDVLELIRSLGFKCKEYSKISRLNKTDKKITYTLRFKSDNGYQIFKLDRKAKKVSISQYTNSETKLISSITPTRTVPSRCIQVDSPNHLYLCDEGWTVTHNTEVFRALEHHLLKTTDENIGIIHLEEDQSTTVKGLATYEDKYPYIHLEDNSSEEEILKAYSKAVKGKDSRVYIYESFDVEDENQLFDNIRFLVSACGCSFIFLDHITWLATGQEDENERIKLDRISQRLKLLAKELDFCMILISHTNDDGRTRGSRNISKVANVVINLQRDKETHDEGERLRTYFSVEKGRGGGSKTGPAGWSEYNPETLVLEDYKPFELGKN